MDAPNSFADRDLGDGLSVYSGRLPEPLVWSAERFEDAWKLRPDVRPTIRIVGRELQTPRWHAAYGEDYRFSGQLTQAQPIPPLLQPLLEWTRNAIHTRLNGLLVNWYEGPDHYIGPHSDSTKNMVRGAPIVTISFGEDRLFRMSRGKGEARVVHDLPAPSGTVFVLPQTTNAVWKHAVPKSKRYTGRRISVTIRAFESWQKHSR